MSDLSRIPYAPLQYQFPDTENTHTSYGDKPAAENTSNLALISYVPPTYPFNSTQAPTDISSEDEPSEEPVRDMYIRIIEKSSRDITGLFGSEINLNPQPEEAQHPAPTSSNTDGQSALFGSGPVAPPTHFYDLTDAAAFFSGEIFGPPTHSASQGSWTSATRWAGQTRQNVPAQSTRTHGSKRSQRPSYK